MKTEKGAIILRPFCCDCADKLMQFFPKNDRGPQTDFERGVA